MLVLALDCPSQVGLGRLSYRIIAAVEGLGHECRATETHCTKNSTSTSDLDL